MNQKEQLTFWMKMGRDQSQMPVNNLFLFSDIENFCLILSMM